VICSGEVIGGSSRRSTFSPHHFTPTGVSSTAVIWLLLHLSERGVGCRLTSPAQHLSLSASQCTHMQVGILSRGDVVSEKIWWLVLVLKPPGVPRQLPTRLADTCTPPRITKNLTHQDRALDAVHTPHDGEDSPSLSPSSPQPSISLLLRFLGPPQEMGRESTRWARRRSSARMIIAHDRSADSSIKNAMS
jgi:hypothetical protein